MAIVVDSEVDEGGCGRQRRWVLVEVRSSVMAFNGGSLCNIFCLTVGNHLWDEAMKSVDRSWRGFGCRGEGLLVGKGGSCDLFES